MIIQNTNAQPVVLPGRQGGADAPKVVADPPGKPAVQEPSAQQLQSAVGAINQAMQVSNRNLRFSVDTETKESVVQVVDTETGELIRQIPSEQALAIASSIDALLARGALLRQKV